MNWVGPLILSIAASALGACSHVVSARPVFAAQLERSPAPVIAVIRCDFYATGDGTSCTPAWNADVSERRSPDSLQHGINFAGLAPQFVLADSSKHSLTAIMDLANLLAQPIGTLTGHERLGVKVLFTSVRVVRGAGTVHLTNPDGALSVGGVAIPYVSYDSVIAGSRSSERDWHFLVSDSASDFTVWLKVQAHFPAETNVRIAPPDSVPSWINADSNVAGPTDSVNTRFVNHIIVVHFRPTASLLDRQLTIASINGVVIGGSPNSGESGAYFVLVPTEKTGTMLFDAATAIGHLPQTRSAYPQIVLGPFSH